MTNNLYHANQLTAYEVYGFINFEDYLKDQIREQLEEVEFTELVMLYNEYCSNNGHDEYYENDEDFLETFFTSISEAVRATQYGDYSFYDDYVRFNGYGNLDSFSEWQVEEDIKGDSDFIRHLFQNYDEIDFIEIDELIENQEEILKKAYQLIAKGY